MFIELQYDVRNCVSTRNNRFAISTPALEQYKGDGITGRAPGCNYTYRRRGCFCRLQCHAPDVDLVTYLDRSNESGYYITPTTSNGMSHPVCWFDYMQVALSNFN
uniref:Uncharacterized protein n=1 Tax=Glossina austeni TaxID=7395 RepID=A0A1A9VBF5_GLOAU